VGIFLLFGNRQFQLSKHLRIREPWVLGLLRNKIRTKKNPASSRYFKVPGDPIFQSFRIRKPWVTGSLKEKKFRIKYLPVLGISKPSETRQFSQNNQKRTGRFLGGSVLCLFQGFGEPWLYVKNRVFGFLRAVFMHLENPPDTRRGFGCWVQFLISA
jgi:hypothetical protein